MIALSLAATLLLAAQRLVAYPPVVEGNLEDDKPFKGGPYAGLSVGQAKTPDGKSLLALKPSIPGSSPVSGRDAAAVAAFVEGRADPAKEPLAQFLTKHPRYVWCRKQGFTCGISKPEALTFAEPVHANTAYSMGSGKVRIEWLYGEAVWYFTELTLRGGKIATVRTQPGWLPIRIGKAR